MNWQDIGYAALWLPLLGVMFVLWYRASEAKGLTPIQWLVAKFWTALIVVIALFSVVVLAAQVML